MSLVFGLFVAQVVQVLQQQQFEQHYGVYGFAASIAFAIFAPHLLELLTKGMPGQHFVEVSQ